MKKIYDVETESTMTKESFDVNAKTAEIDFSYFNKDSEAVDKGVTQPQPQTREAQEVIYIDDSLDESEDFDLISDRKVKPMPEEIKEKKRPNWTAIIFIAISIALASALVFVSVRYFDQLKETTNMRGLVAEAEVVKKNNDSQISTSEKKLADVQKKLEDAEKKVTELEKAKTDLADAQTKLAAAQADATSKQAQIDAALKAQTEAATKVAALEKEVTDLKAQLDAVKKAAGAAA